MRYLVDTNLLVGHNTRILLACLVFYLEALSGKW